MNFVIPFPPHSGNHQHGARGAQRFMSPEMRTWRNAVQRKIDEERKAYGGEYRLENGRYRVVMIVAVPDARRRDLDNVAKVVLDAVSDQKGKYALPILGAIDDDCRVDELNIHRVAVMKGSGHVAVEIERIG